jgi:predicted Rossmann fold nucleotide-binding protein DprA/Smf involved in DNA uptake
MLNRIIIALSLGIVIFGSVFYFVRKSIKTEELAKQQQQQIVIQNEVIQDGKDTTKRKAIAKSVSVSDNLKWLRDKAAGSESNKD